MASSGLHPKFSSLLARYATAAAFFVSMSSTATALVPTTIYVSGGSGISPYYSFFQNSDLTGALDLTTVEGDSLLTSETYTFVKDSTSHPFYISDQGYNAMSSIFNINIDGDGSYTSGIRGGESLTLSFNNFNVESDTLFYYCSAHSNMIGAFNVSAVPEPSSYAAIAGLLGLSMVLTRRKIRD
ncbi:MAG: PEP-CTERM sorting domain-containing protein [Puniceicoccaceae bacterium]|nr:PEP-CTERM sorting domain-containing protein [Puniceicoccaceae bacterium]